MPWLNPTIQLLLECGWRDFIHVIDIGRDEVIIQYCQNGNAKEFTNVIEQQDCI